MDFALSWETFMAVSNGLGLIMIAISLLLIAEALRFLVGWRVDSRVAMLERRLADERAIRARPCTLADCKKRFHQALTTPVPDGFIDRHLGKDVVPDRDERP